MKGDPMNDTYHKLIKLLDAHHAHYRLIDHPPEGRTEIVSGYRGNQLSEAAKCMVLIVHLGKKETKYVLGVIPGDMQIDFEAVKTLMSASYVSFAPAELTEHLAQSVVGTVLPFAFDPQLELIVDPSLLAHEEIYFNAARLDQSMALKAKDYISIVHPRVEPIAKSPSVQKEIAGDTASLSNLRHSCAHLLAAAVMELWPNTKRTIGPAIEDGFYYDFDFGEAKISDADFPKIEEKMHELVKSWKEFERKEIKKEEAIAEYKDNEYKKELIEEFASEGQLLTLYTSGKYTDLCRGGHCPHPNNDLKHFKLLSVAGAYWRGSEKNKMLTRIYGTCFPSKKELDEHLHNLEEAKKRDHRKLGKELGLFVFSDLVGSGLPLLTPKGATIRRILERFIVDEEIKRGYQHVVTPPLARVDLYRKSGHYPYYKETMYPTMKVDEDELILRPMTCPHHFQLYASQPRSYRELPIRYAELADLFRYEKSGELTGLMRVRMFCLADAHIICTKEQAIDEINRVLDLIEYVNDTFGLVKGKDYRYRLSLGNRKDNNKYYKDDAAWDYAEDVLRNVLISRASPYYEAKNEAAFYGPKIDVQVKNVAGKEETAFTDQYDFVMPKRFSLKYIDDTGSEQEPIVIHRSSIGAFERTMAFLIEHYAGAFPLWLSPTQVIVIPIAERHNAAAQMVVSELKKHSIRVESDTRSEPMQAKVRDHTLQKQPYLAIIGDREIENKTVSVRKRGTKELQALALSDFIAQLVHEIEQKAH